MQGNDHRILIIGAGHAGDAVAAALRQYGHAGPITLLGEEIFAPYQRPPLSKAWLKGTIAEPALALRAADFYARQNITLHLNQRALAIDRERRVVSLADGETLPYATLILATGARARDLPVPSADLPHVFRLRGRADADALRGALRPGARLAIIGGGYIGLEIAASARTLAVAVTVLEREPRLLARVASPQLAAFFQRLHEAQGVRFQLAAEIQAITPEAVILADGHIIAADAVIVGIGAVPNMELARAAGLACGNGVIVDAAARTSDPAIFAIGDCTLRPIAQYDRVLRLESVPNAQEQAKQAAAAITGRPPPAGEIPWFWSDQYAARLQIAGLLLDVAETVLRPLPGPDRFAAFHLGADGAVRAVEAVNAPEEFMAGRVMIARRRLPARTALADPSVPMKTIAA